MFGPVSDVGKRGSIIKSEVRKELVDDIILSSSDDNKKYLCIGFSLWHWQRQGFPLMLSINRLRPLVPNTRWHGLESC